MRKRDESATAIAVHCPTCGEHVSANVVATHDWWHETDPPALASLVSCTRCDGAMLTIQEDYGRGFAEDRPVRVWPPPEPRLSYGVPSDMRRAHEEALNCFEAKAYTGCALMVRRTLEAFCVTKGAKSGPLKKRLDKLRDGEQLDERLWQLANAIRDIGNDAAHDMLNEVSRQDARDLLDLCRAFLEYNYDVVKKQQDVLERREARRSQREENGQTQPA